MIKDSRGGTKFCAPAWHIDPDIQVAHTLPAEVYRDATWFLRQQEQVFARSWQFAADLSQLQEPGQVLPWTLLPGCLDEPLLLTRQAGEEIHCLSNVCTHRGFKLVEHPCQTRGLLCRYHGRRFDLGGQMLSMPEFEAANAFPGPADHLSRVPLGQWGSFLFVNLNPQLPFTQWIQPLHERLAWVPFEDFQFSGEHSRSYEIPANWALYCDNYLEGFHIPFVHPGLNQVLDYGSYQTELLPQGVLQLGIADDPAALFDIPTHHPDHGKQIAAYYYWLFPNVMFNLYPWGLSLNLVQPLEPGKTRVSYLTYLWDESRWNQGAGAGLHQVEMEDQAVVTRVQQGIQSRLYHRGRYSPSRETGVHHFHRLLHQHLSA